MSSSHQGKFLRLNSLEGACQTYPAQSSENTKMAIASVDTKMPPCVKESKWFAHYENADLFHQHCSPMLHQQQYQYYPTAPNYHYQVPYNLSKGQFEVWPMQVTPLMNQVAYVPSNSNGNVQANNQGLSKCVSSILEWSSALANAVTTTFFSTHSSSLNPNAKVFTPLNPNAKEFQPKASPVPDKTITSPELKKAAQRKNTP